MDDDQKDLTRDDDMEEEDDLLGDDDLSIGKKKAKGGLGDDDSLDALADEEDSVLPDDAFDDTEPEDLW